MNMSDLIIKVLNLLDPLDLKVFPYDEYEIEAQRIAEHLSSMPHEDKLASYIYQLFHEEAPKSSMALIEYNRAAEIICSVYNLSKEK